MRVGQWLRARSAAVLWKLLALALWNSCAAGLDAAAVAGAAMPRIWDIGVVVALAGRFARVGGVAMGQGLVV